VWAPRRRALPCSSSLRAPPLLVPLVSIQRRPFSKRTCIGKMTPGGAGTHTGHTVKRHTRGAGTGHSVTRGHTGTRISQTYRQTSQPSQPTKAPAPHETARRPNPRPTLKSRCGPRSRPLLGPRGRLSSEKRPPPGRACEPETLHNRALNRLNRIGNSLYSCSRSWYSVEHTTVPQAQ